MEWFNAGAGRVLVFGAMLVWVVCVFVGTQWLLTRVFTWWDHRHGRRTPEEDIADWQRAAEMRRQLWAMERQIREEQLSDEDREWTRQSRERQAEITREARRRLGLPDTEGEG